MANNDDLTASTSTEGIPSSISWDDIVKAMELIPPCPFAEYMKKEGCDPNDGWVMVVPLIIEKKAGTLPKYVIASPYVGQPVLIDTNQPELNFLTPILR